MGSSAVSGATLPTRSINDKIRASNYKKKPLEESEGKGLGRYIRSPFLGIVRGLQRYYDLSTGYIDYRFNLQVISICKLYIQLDLISAAVIC